MSIAVRRVTILSLLSILFLFGGCATSRSRPTWRDAQLATLTSEGFVRTDRGWEFSMNDRLLFNTDASDILPDQSAIVAKIAGRLLGVGIEGATVEGHTDDTGSARYNQELAKRRADAVADVLVKSGFARSSVTSVSLGELYPVGSNRTAEGRHENRRVVILVTAL